MIVIASDHAGFELKKKIVKYFEKQQQSFVDLGANIFDALDSFATYSKIAVDYFVKNCDTQKDFLILICGSGIGMSISANRNHNIRAVLAYTKKQVVQARLHNNANCLCLGGRNTSFFKAKQILNSFLKTEFLGGKYQDRMNEIN